MGEIIGIGMAVLKKNGRPYFYDCTSFPVVWTNESKHRFYPVENGTGYVSNDVIKDFDDNYKIRPFKNYEEEIQLYL